MGFFFPFSLFKKQAREKADFDEDDENLSSFKLSHPELYELLKSTQEKIALIERDESSAFDVGAMELQPRHELDARVRAEQNLSIKLGKDEHEQLRRAEALRVLDGH